MIGWLKLTDEQRKATIDQAEQRSGIPAKAIEKDWWITLLLKTLFELPYAPYFAFKGGTSLSKGFGLIQRFSEDVDIALAPEVFGGKYQTAPTHSYVKKIKKLGCEFTTDQLLPSIKQDLIKQGVDPFQFEIWAQEVPKNFPDTDPQTIYVRYQSLFPDHYYLANEVKIEFGVRSFPEAISEVKIQSLLWEYLPLDAYREIPFVVAAAAPNKTFLEKTFLLHEKFKYYRPKMYWRWKLAWKDSRVIYMICQK